MKTDFVPPPKCENPYCRYGKVWLWNKQAHADCECQKEIHAQEFLRHIPASTIPAFTCKSFLTLKPDPLKTSYHFEGVPDRVWAMLRGELKPFYNQLRILTIDTYEAAGIYAAGENSAPVEELLNAHILIFYLSGVTRSEKFTQIIRWVYQVRVMRGLPVWFVAEKDFKSYERDTEDLLKFLPKVPKAMIPDHLQVVAAQQVALLVAVPAAIPVPEQTPRETQEIPEAILTEIQTPPRVGNQFTPNTPTGYDPDLKPIKSSGGRPKGSKDSKPRKLYTRKGESS